MKNKSMLNKLWVKLTVAIMLTQLFIPSITAFADVVSNPPQETITQELEKEAIVDEENKETDLTKVSDVTENKDSEEKNSQTTVGENQNANDSPIVEKELPVFEVIESSTNEVIEPSSKIITFNENGTPMLDGEAFYKNEEQITKEDLAELMKQGGNTQSDGSTVLARSVRANVTIEYLGQVIYGYNVVGHFRVNGEDAFCIEHSKPTPPTGTPADDGLIYNDVNVRSALYYGWNGSENIFTDFAMGYTATSLVVSYYYTGVASGINTPEAQALMNKVASNPVPNPSASFSTSNPTVSIVNGQQRTENITLNADSRNVFKLPIPAGMTFNLVGGGTQTNTTVNIKGGDTFFLTANMSYTNNYATGALHGSMKKWQAVLTKPNDSSLQTLGRGGWFDPDFTLQFKATFFAREGWLNLVKKGNDTTQNIAGAQYQILQNNAVLQTVTTATDGTIKTKGLLPGNYQVKEIKAPNGYLLDKTVKTVIVRSNETTTVTFTNIAVLGQFVLFKQDAQTGNIAQGDASLVGAEFDIINSAGTVVDKVVIAPDGSEFKATSKPLPPGNYKRVETKAPVGYVLDPTPVPMELKYETQEIPLVTTTDRVNNQVILGKVEIQKYYELIVGGGHLSPEPGAEFTVTLKSSGVEYGRKETDAKGHVEFDKLPYGRYVVSQTKSLPGLIKVDDFEVEVTEDGATYFYAILNNTFTSPMKIVKADADTGKNVLVPGTLFEITIGDTDELYTETTHNISQFETNENGEILLFNKMPFGEYKLHEIKAPDGYVKNTEPMDFIINEESQENGLVTVTFKNKAQVSKITLTKTGEVLTDADKVETDYGTQYNPVYTQKPLEGAEFEFSAAEDIYTNDGTLRYSEFQVVDSGISDATGQIVTDPETKTFYPGKYYAVEKSAPNGYVVDPTTIPFEVVYEGEDIEISSTAVQAKNKLQELLVKIYKTEETIVTWENGEAVTEQVPADGKEFGIYARDAFTFDTNEVIPADGLMGLATTKDGVAAFQAKFPQGKFYVREVDAGVGHLLDETEYDFEFTAQNNVPVYEIGIWKDSVAYGNENLLKIARYSVENELARASVELTKIDDLDGKPLENVAFNLIHTDADGKETIVGEYKTDSEGKIKVENLPTGEYKFVETKPLDWYEANKEEYKFTVSPDNDGELIELNVVNKRKPLEITTLFATTVGGLKQVNPDVDNDLTDYIEVRGGKAGHEYYVDTVYRNSATGEAVSSSEFSFVSTGDAIQKLSTNLFLPKGTMKDGMSLTATHIFYEDKEKTKEIGREDDLTLKLQTVDFKTPKVGIKTKAHTGDGKTQTFTHGDIIDAYDNVDLTHEDVLDGTKRAFKAILVAVIPENGKTVERDIWESEKIDYIVNDQKFAQSVVTKVDTGSYPEGTSFYFKEIGYNEAGEKDTEHNFDGRDRNQSLTPVKKPLPLPQTGENNKIIFMIAGLVIVASVGAWFGLSTNKKKKEAKKQEEKQMNMALTYGYSGPESIFSTEDDQGKVYAATCLILSTIKYNYKFKSDLEEYKRLWEKIGLKDEDFSLSPN
ncbi:MULTISPECIES: SpaA isopeptide-forming pilin-related protein [Carnobacterium]|uniref:SpaA isopeptide-forming pilin-related protein n=1 Tax=Carnobacterium TaxID=2747 RepID=UPI00055148F1|nr:SpaA isopeptide-forming pilin-related protein [Carnobacterium maltaromaticum]KRN69321.1 collagen adhesion protein [Carnobacterium maltaromaticum DSM 20342]